MLIATSYVGIVILLVVLLVAIPGVVIAMGAQGRRFGAGRSVEFKADDRTESGTIIELGKTGVLIQGADGNVHDVPQGDVTLL